MSPRVWVADAACCGADVRLFFRRGERVEHVDAARAYCERCPVTAECLAVTVAGDEAGLWAGTTTRDRRTIAA